MGRGNVAMQYSADLRGDVTVVTVRGRLSIGFVEELNAFLRALHDEGRSKFLFDLLEMEHIVSGGIGVLIGFNEIVKKSGGQVQLCRVHPRVQRIFAMMSLDAFFTIHEDVDGALESF
ncbi:MAG: STAS domain-containing protein [Planctomycetota bacterium]|jgi:anti-anti-sigma factor